VNAGRSGHSIAKGVFFYKFRGFLDLTLKKNNRFRFFFSNRKCKKNLETGGTPGADILIKTRRFRSLSNKPFFI
jgi:hypothetical protein